MTPLPQCAAFAMASALILQTAGAATILADTSDASPINTGTAGLGTPQNLSVARVSATTLRIGRYDDATEAPSGSNAAAVFPFLLPNLGAVANPFTAATFTFNLTNTTNNFNVNLDGLGVRGTAAVSPEDFRFSDTNGSTPATTIQTDILTITSLPGAKTSADFASYLNTQYASGTNAGKYVFLRLAVNAGASQMFDNANNGYTVTSANEASNRPVINYTSPIPEPGITMLLTGLSGLALLRRTRSR